MANLKIGKENSVHDIGFRVPFNVLQKYSGKNQVSLLNNLKSNQIKVTTSESNPQNVFIHLNKSDFIKNTLKNDVVSKILPSHLHKSKRYIIEFR